MQLKDYPSVETKLTKQSFFCLNVSYLSLVRVSLAVEITLTVSCSLAFIMAFLLLQMSSFQLRFGDVCVCSKCQTAY